VRRFTLPARSIWLTAWTIWLFDFASKQWAMSNLSSTPREVLGSLLKFTLVRNSGAAFSFASGFTILFSLLAVAVIATIIRFASVITSRGWLFTAGLLLGGVLGNVTDRLFRSPGFLTGHVIDWIELPHWPIFNIADIAIFSAATTAFVLSLRNIPPITAVR
jgi:signal peptidase II